MSTPNAEFIRNKPESVTETLNQQNQKNPVNKITLVAWIIILLISLPIFVYVASNPSVLLWVEANQPSQGVEYARNLFQQGKTKEAIEQLKRSIEFWRELYQETKQKRHKVQLALVLAELANLYSRHGTHEQLTSSLTLYEEALELDPSISHGSVWVYYGIALNKLNHYKKAVDAFTNTFSYKYAPICLQAVYERGQSYLMLNQTEKAADDWAAWLQFTGSTSPSSIETIDDLPESETAEYFIVKAMMFYEAEQNTKALECFERALMLNPANRFADYWVNALSNQPIQTTLGNIPLQDCFPPQNPDQHLIRHSYINLYSQKNQTLTLDLELSAQLRGNTLPELTIEQAGKTPHAIIVNENQPTVYSQSLELNEGINRLSFMGPDTGAVESTPQIFLHSLSVSIK